MKTYVYKAEYLGDFKNEIKVCNGKFQHSEGPVGNAIFYDIEDYLKFIRLMDESNGPEEDYTLITEYH